MRPLIPLVILAHFFPLLSAEEPTAPLPQENLSGPPVVTARAWVVVDGESGEILGGEQSGTPLKTASTTKMMTCFVILGLMDADPAVAEEWVEVSEFAAATRGSRAELDAGDSIRVRDALFALMLPSGNDMANALAEHFDARFEPPGEESPESLRSSVYDTRRRFLAEMNRTAMRIGMGATQYRSAIGDGGSAEDPTASAEGLAVLARAAMEHETFREIVGTARHEGVVVPVEGEEEVRAWENTNRLLGLAGNYDGIKTGTTRTAGSCLVASGRHEGRWLVVVVLGAAGNEARYADARNLFRWGWRR